MLRKEVLSSLIDAKKMAILKALLFSSGESCLKEVAEKSGVSLTSTFRLLQELVALEVVQRREWKNSKVYSGRNNDKVAFLKELLAEEYDGLKEFVQAVGSLPGVQSLILQGGQKKGKANLLLIGEGINNEKVEEACKLVKEKGFELSYLTLTKQQYEQMLRMGLYSGEKTVLK